MTSELPISSPYRSTPGAAVSEAERNQLSTRLNAAFEAGTIDADDYRARLDRLFAARTLGELVPVVDGLPAPQTHDTPALVASGGGRPGELAPARDARGVSLVVVGGVVSGLLLLVILLVILSA